MERQRGGNDRDTGWHNDATWTPQSGGEQRVHPHERLGNQERQALAQEQAGRAEETDVHNQVDLEDIHLGGLSDEFEETDVHNQVDLDRETDVQSADPVAVEMTRYNMRQLGMGTGPTVSDNLQTDARTAGREDAAEALQRYSERRLVTLVDALVTRRDEAPRPWRLGFPYTVIAEQWPAEFVAEYADVLWLLESNPNMSVLSLDADPETKRTLVVHLGRPATQSPGLVETAMQTLDTSALLASAPYFESVADAYGDDVLEGVITVYPRATITPAQLATALRRLHEESPEQHLSEIRNREDAALAEYLQALATGSMESTQSGGPSDTGSTATDDDEPGPSE